MTTRIGVAHARVGLLGNPGDGYGGKALAMALRDFRARVTITPARDFAINDEDALRFPHLSDALSALDAPRGSDGSRLLSAALLRFGAFAPEVARLERGDERGRFHVTFESDVPREVGLSGSSAIIIAALRALSAHFETAIAPHDLAELALAAEVDDLGIAAGPMDRVIQAYEGLVFMDFSRPRGPDAYRRLDPSILPPLFVAWDPGGGESSGVVHADVRSRFEAGDPQVRAAIARFPEIAIEGLRCLEAGDRAGFRRCVDENFDTRARIWTLRDRDLELVEIGRRFGAAVKFCGSGGAVVGVLNEADEWEPIASAYRAAGYASLRPSLASRSS